MADTEESWTELQTAIGVLLRHISASQSRRLQSELTLKRAGFALAKVYMFIPFLSHLHKSELWPRIS